MLLTNISANFAKKYQQYGDQYSNYLALLIVVAGIFLRLVQYFGNRSLWGDELMLELNLSSRSYLELLQPLDHDQAAPPIFLWIEKLAIQLFGNHEYSLRLFPLIAGIISTVAFYKLGKWAVSGVALPIAMLLFACLQYPLYYATEVKQYSSDVMVALLLSLLLIPLRDQILGRGRALLLGLVGAIAIWLSHPAVFVLAGIEIANLVTTPAERRKSILLNRWPAYLLWIGSFAALYFLITAKVMKNQYLQSSWGGEYPGTIFDIVWLLDSLGRVFYRPLGFPGKTDGVAMLAFVVGCVGFYKRDRVKLLILVSPIIVTLFATYLHKYPFRGRLILFLAPFFILIIAEAITFLLAQFDRRKYLAIAGVVLAVLLVFPSVIRAGGLVFSPEKREEIRPVMEYIKTHQQPGDIIYTNAGMQFNYYAGRYGYSPSDYVTGYPYFFDAERFSEESWNEFMRQSKRLQSQQRVWFLFVALTKSEAPLLKPHLDRIGQELDSFKQPGALTYLYKLK